MVPGAMDLQLYHGDSYYWVIRVWQDPGKTQPADLTGVTAKAEIRDRPAGTVIIGMTCEVELPNIVNCELEADASQMLPASGVWDLQLTWPGGDVGTILAGKVRVTPDVTDSTLSTSSTLKTRITR